jgi:hypothetical protein
MLRTEVWCEAPIVPDRICQSLSRLLLEVLVEAGRGMAYHVISLVLALAEAAEVLEPIGLTTKAVL